MTEADYRRLTGRLYESAVPAVLEARKPWREQYTVGQRVEVKTVSSTHGVRWRGATVTRVPTRKVEGGTLRGRFAVMLDKGSEIEWKTGKSIRPEKK